MEHDGLNYDPDFGKLVRKLDQEQRNINERMKNAYYKKRQGQLEKVYEKISRQNKDAAARAEMVKYGPGNKTMIETMIAICVDEGTTPPGRAQLNKNAEAKKQAAVKKIKDKDDSEWIQEEIDSKLIKEWRSFGKTARDWTKTKVITFD